MKTNDSINVDVRPFLRAIRQLIKEEIDGERDKIFDELKEDLQGYVDRRIREVTQQN